MPVRESCSISVFVLGTTEEQASCASHTMIMIAMFHVRLIGCVIQAICFVLILCHQRCSCTAGAQAAKLTECKAMQHEEFEAMTASSKLHQHDLVTKLRQVLPAAPQTHLAISYALSDWHNIGVLDIDSTHLLLTS